MILRTLLILAVLVTLSSRAFAQSVSIPADLVTAADSLKATVKLPAPAKADGTLKLTWTDSYGRTVGTLDVPVKAGATEAAVALPLAPAVAMQNFLQGELTAGEQTIKIPKAEFVVTPAAGPWLDYEVCMYYAYKTPAQQQALRDVGVTAGQIQSGRTQVPDGGKVWWAYNYRAYCDQINHRYFAEYHTPAYEPKHKLLQLAEAEHKKDPTSLEPFKRKPCFHDPAARAEAMARQRTAVEAQRRFKPFMYGTDECGTANLVEAWDFCYDERTLAAMRTWLMKQYGSLAAINAEWGTDFKTIDAVVPLTTDQTMARPGENFSSWSDHRTFMNITFADVLAEAGAVMKAVDKDALNSIVGAQMPCAYGGYDYWLLSQALDAIEPYNIGNSREIWRSFAPDKPAVTTGFGFGDMEVWRLWYQALHGDVGLIVYDEKNVYLDADAKPTKLGAAIAPTYKELTGGLVRQLHAGRRVSDSVAIHYSQPSINAHWMLEVRPSGKNWFNRGSASERTRSEFLRLRQSAIYLLEDNLRQYDFVAYAQLEDKSFDKSDAKVLILPQSIAMSPAECDAVRRFVERGGTVIADCRTALMDGHCKMLEKGQLDDLFGIERKDTKFAPGKPGLTPQTIKQLELTMAGMLAGTGGMEKVSAAEPGVKAAAGAQACFKDAAGTPAVIVKERGKGRTIYLNAVITDYCRWRLRPPEGEPLRVLVEKILNSSHIASQYDVTLADGSPAVGVEIHPWQVGEMRILGLHRNYGLAVSELGPPEYQKQDALQKPMTVKVKLDAKSAVYDQRAGKLLGVTDSVTVELDKFAPTILTILPEPVKSLEIAAPAGVARGEIVKATFSLAGGKVGGPHAFRVRLAGPDGKDLPWLTQTVVAGADGKAACALPIALSDPAGKYKLIVRDVPTGVSAEADIAVK